MWFDFTQSALRHPLMGSLFEVCRKNPLREISQNCADFGVKWTIVVHNGAKLEQLWCTVVQYHLKIEQIMVQSEQLRWKITAERALQLHNWQGATNAFDLFTKSNWLGYHVKKSMWLADANMSSTMSRGEEELKGNEQKTSNRSWSKWSVLARACSSEIELPWPAIKKAFHQ